MSDRKKQYEDELKEKKSWKRTEGLDNSLAKREDYSRTKKWEYGGIYDKDGNPLVEKTSRSKERVKWDGAECLKAEGATLTHNHPNDSCFSGADIRFAEKWGLMEIRATTANGLTYCLRRPNDGDAKRGRLTDFGDRYQREYESYYKNVTTKGYNAEAANHPYPSLSNFKDYESYAKEWNRVNKIRNGLLEKWNKKFDKWCSAWVRDHAKEYGWNYREELR